MELSLAIEADEPLKIWSAKQFAQRQLVATDWLVPGLLRMGTTSLLVAESKTGKSLLHYDWAYSVATGTGWGEFPATDPKKVLIVQTDEPEVDCQNRIIYRGLDSLENVSVMTSFSTHQIARIRKEIANKNLDLVIIDSLTSINKFSGISANDIEFAYFMYRLKDLASEFGCHILCVHHTNKAPGQAGLEKVAGSYGIPASVSDIFLLERRPGAEQDDLERILKRLGSRSDGRSAWKIRLNLEDNSFEYLGHCDKNGDTDERAEKETQNKLENKELILAFLQAHAPVAYEALEVAEELKINRDTVRRLLGDLSKGDAPLIASKRSSREGARCNAYFYPTDQLTADQLPDQLPDQLSNPSAARNTASTDQVISKKGGKTFSPDHVTVAAETNIDCDSSAPKSENFPTDQVADQLIKNPSNSFPASDTATDQATDQLNGADQLEQTPPYPSIGDWIYARPNKKYPGEVCYAKDFVKSEIRAAVFRQGKVGTVNVSRWTWEQGEWEPYDPNKHPAIPEALWGFKQKQIEEQSAANKSKVEAPTEIVEASEPPEPKFKEGDRVSWTEKAEFGTIKRHEQSPEKCLVHLDKHGEALIEESKLELVKTNPRFVVGDRCRYKDQVGTVVFPHLNSPYVVWDEPDRSGIAIRSLAGLETTTEEGGELLPAPKAVANYLSLKCGDTIRIGKHPQHKPKWYQKGGQKVRVLSIILGLSANQLFAIAEIPGEEFPVKLFLSAVDIVEGASE